MEPEPDPSKLYHDYNSNQNNPPEYKLILPIMNEDSINHLIPENNRAGNRRWLQTEGNAENVEQSFTS